MNFEPQPTRTYKSELTFLSIMTLIFGFSCLIFGYLLLPVAAGFYAALLATEKKEGRILSYIIPLVLLLANVFINGFYSLEAISYVVVGAIIFYGFDRKKNKAYTVFFAVTALVVLMAFSFILLAYDKVGTFKTSALSDFFIDLYETGKTKFVAFLTSFLSVDENGVTYYNYNPSEAVDMYNSFILMMIPMVAIFSLISVGISSRILGNRITKVNSKDERIEGWKFVTSPFIAYSYVVISIMTSISTQGIVGTALSFVASILMAVYFYIGISSLYGFITLKKSRAFAIVSIALVIFIFYSFAPQIIALIGVFVNNAIYKNHNSENAGA